MRPKLSTDGVEAVGRPRHELVERADELGGGGDGVARLVRPGAVPAAAADDDVQGVAVGGEGAGADADLAGSPRGVDVQGEDRADACRGRRRRSSAGRRWRFLRRAARWPASASGQGAAPATSSRRSASAAPSDDRRVGVVAAGVHDAVARAAVRDVLFVLDEQGVDVAANGDASRRRRSPGLSAITPQPSGPMRPRGRRRQPLVEQQARFELGAARLGMGVQMAAQRDDLGLSSATIASSDASSRQA